jgi:hypothetical protein
MYALYYASILRCWHLVWILVRTDRPYLGVGCHNFHPMNHRPEVEGMDTVDTCIGEDKAAELEVVKREPEGVVLVRHWTDDGATRQHRTRREWEELGKLGCSKDQPTFAT